MSLPTPALTVHASDQPFSCGVPVPVDSVGRLLRGAVLTDSAGQEHPAQLAVLTPPGLHDLQWLEVSCAGAAVGPAVLGEGPAADGDPLLSEAAGELRLHLADGHDCVLAGDPVKPPLQLQGADGEVIGALTPEMSIDNVLHLEPETGERQPRVVLAGAVRAVAELKGRLQGRPGEPSFHYRLTVEVWRGVPAARVDWRLSHEVPGVAAFEVERATLRGAWRLRGDTQRLFHQINHGAYYKPRRVLNPRAVALLADSSCGPVHVADPAMLLDTADYAAYLKPPLTPTQDWLALIGEDRAVAMRLLDFAASRPNQLRGAGSELSYDMLPSGHGRAWPQGRRRQQSLLLAVGGGVDDAEAMLAAMAALDREGRAQAAPDYLRETGAFDMQMTMPDAKGQNVRLSRILDRLCILKTPGDKWDLGDTIDPGYSRTYPPVANRAEYLPGAPRMELRFNPVGRTLWSNFPEGILEPVWTNNEYDMIHALATELSRTGRNSHHQLLRWVARHTIDIDFCAFSDDRWHHRAQPAHSQHHNTTGAYPSHFWTQGLIQYYALTGDRDAEAVFLALGDKIIECNHLPEMRAWDFDRELGWGLLSLVCLVEAGYQRYYEEALEISEFLMNFDRAGYNRAVPTNLGRQGRSLERQMVDSSFCYASMMEALDRFQRCSERQDLAEWLEVLLHQLREEAWNAIDEGEVPNIRAMLTVPMAIGYERTGDADFIEVGLVILEHFFDTLALGEELYLGYVKPNAMNYRGFSRFLGHAHRLGHLREFELKGLQRRRRRG